jgi:SAM-dependent methyltransferase
MLSATDRQWIKWAKENPYYGVLGIESTAVDDPEVKARFFETGRDDLRRAIEGVEAMFGLINRGAALDFGCGVGRILKSMAREFRTTWGVDVADEMLETARKNCRSVGDVRLAKSVSDVAASGASFDFVHSYIVLQHIRPRQGIPIIIDLIKLLKPGGLFALHFTIGDSRIKTRRLNYFRYRIRPLHWAYNVKMGRPWNESITEMNCYDLSQILGAIKPNCEPLLGLRHIDQAGPVGVMLMGKRR